MKEKKECKIIKDLLPIYIENLLSDDTKEYVEKHLEECEECKDTLEAMKENINIKNDEIEKKKVNYLKKFNNKMNILKAILLIIFIIIVLVIGRKIIIIANLSNKAKKIQNTADNYYARLEGTFAGEYTKSEWYCKGENYVAKIITYNEKSGIKEIDYYKNGNEHLMITNVNGIQYTSQEAIISKTTLLPYYNNFMEKICMALSYGIESTKLGDIECFVLKDDSVENYIDKNTGLLVKQINRSNNTVTDYHYEFNVVEDSKLLLPNV